MARSLQEIARAAEARNAAARPQLLPSTPPQEEAPNLSLLESIGDVAFAPLRGVEGAVQDLYGLADTLAFDALPDYEERILGRSRTAVGGLVEGITNFGAGFVGAGFLPLGWTAKLGRLAPFVKGAVKGAVADFAVFDGHEERLSNLIQAFPLLQNPVTEYLSAKEDDSQIEGRIKNVLEGLGVGALTELTMLGLKSLRVGREARAKGLPEAEVEALVDGVVPPEAVDDAWRRAADYDPGDPKPGEIGSPAQPEAIDATRPVPDPEPQIKLPQAAPDPAAILRSFDVDEATAKSLYQEAKRRQATLEGEVGGILELDPRVNPRNLTEAERFAQGMLKTDLNLSRYTGPDGALQLLRASEQLLEPLRGLGDASRRTLKQQEEAGLKELADLVGERNPHRLMVSLQKDVSDLTALNRRVLAYKTALQAYGDHTFRLADKAFKATGSDADLVEFMQSLSTLNDLELGVKSLLGEQGRGLGANRISVKFKPGLFGREEVDAALHEVGGRKRAMALAEKYRILHQGAPDDLTRAARGIDMAKGVAGRRAFGILNEYWYNSLLGRPTTIVVNAMSNGLASVYRPLETIAGGLLTGNSEVMADGIAEIGNLVHSARESWEAAMASLRGGGEVLDPKSLVSDIHDVRSGAINAEAFGADSDSVHGAAINWAGKLTRWPSKTLQVTDQFFQQLNARSIARTQLTKELLKNPAIPKSAVGELVAAEMDKLFHRGQLYGQAVLYKKGVEEAARRGLTAKTAVDEFAQEYVRKAAESPEHSRLQSIATAAKERAEEATFTAALTPGTIPYRIQEAVIAHPYLRLVMPFVRTPVNLIKASHERTTGALGGVAQLLAAKRFPSLAANLERSKNLFVRDMLSGSPRRKADAIGRLAFGMSTATLVITKAAETGDDGLPLLTGAGPSDKEQRRILEASGWQPYSIRIGDKYVSYARLDPFATVMGTAADLVNYVKYAAAEDQSAVEDATYGFAVALATNFTNKTYLSGLAGALEALQDPQRRFPTYMRTLAASFVPGQFAAVVPVVDPHMREVRGIMDAMRARWPGASDSLPPLRNMLGEPVDRAKSLGSEASSILNAFVPILYREVSDDVVNRELARLKHGFTPPRRTRGALDLTEVIGRNGQNAYDRWLELQGKVKLGGKDLRASLRQLMTSTNYKRLTPDSTEDQQSPRISLVQNRIEDYRATAWRQLLREFPELAQAEQSRVERRTRLRQGQDISTQQPTAAPAQQLIQTLLQPRQ